VSIRARIFIVVGIVVAAAFLQAGVVVVVEMRRAAMNGAMDRAVWRYDNQSRLVDAIVQLDNVERAYQATGDAALHQELLRLWALYERTSTLLPQYVDDPVSTREFAALDALIRDWHERASRLPEPPAVSSRPGSPQADVAALMHRIRGALDRFDTQERNRLTEQRLAASGQSLRSTLLTLGIPAIALVLLLLLVAYIARILLDPLAAVARSARQISGGNFEVSLPPSSRDELGALVDAFREMATAVQRRQHDLTDTLAREREISQQYDALRTKAEREHERLLATIETVPVAMVIVEAGSNRITQQNKAADLLVGREPDDDAARLEYWASFRLTMRDGTESTVAEWARDRLASGGVVAGEELVVQHPLGHAIPILVSAAPLWDEAGALSGGVVAFQDITNLHEIDRLKSEFVSIVSHELRTPLTSIRGALQLLVAEATLAEPDHEMLMTVALSNTERLVRIINDILDISKIEAGKMELHLRPHDAGDIVRVSLQSVEQIARATHVTLTAIVEPNLPPVVVDLDRTVQAVVNLLSNGLKFAPHGSAVTLEVRRKGEGFVALSVTDRGRGIPAEQFDKLFEKFRQLDSADNRKVHGTGLGLAIVKALVEIQGGRVNVESEVGAGSTFTITVPVAPKAR
jgi:PAS domain S-box-containing protein